MSDAIAMRQIDSTLILLLTLLFLLLMGGEVE